MLSVVVCLQLVWWGLGLVTAWSTTAPAPSSVPRLARIAGRPIADVEVRARDGVRTRAWLVTADGEGGARRCVVLAAGIRANRTAMLSRADFYIARGWSTLLVDLRGTGESDPERISMGWHEALDLLAWRRELRGRGFDDVAVHGQSLGAAAAAYTAVRADDGDPAWAFVVLESCYRDIDEALRARMLDAPSWLLLPVYTWAGLLLGVDAARLDPVAAVASLDAPLFVTCGERDRLVGVGATAALLAACPSDDKRRHDVAGVGHRDIWGPGGDGLRSALAAFVAAR